MQLILPAGAGQIMKISPSPWVINFTMEFSKLKQENASDQNNENEA
jgi:hypothetical protein